MKRQEISRLHWISLPPAASSVITPPRCFMRKFALIFLVAAANYSPAAEPQPGLALTWRVGETTVATVVPNLWLYVPAGQSPSPFAPAGQFTATFEGFVNIDLRGDYSFHATGKGGVLGL